MPTLSLADEFFLVNHDRRGKPLIRRELLGGGLAAALLAELVMQRRAGMRDGRVTVLAAQDRGDEADEADPADRADEATDFMLRSVAGQATSYPIRTWVDNLDDTAYELIARRVTERGIVRRVRTRRLLGAARERFPAATREAVGPLVSLDEVIEDPERADVQRALLVTMVAATGAEHALASEPDRDRVRAAVARLAESLPADLAELLAGFDEAITARLLSIRR